MIRNDLSTPLVSREHLDAVCNWDDGVGDSENGKAADTNDPRGLGYCGYYSYYGYFGYYSYYGYCGYFGYYGYYGTTGRYKWNTDKADTNDPHTNNGYYTGLYDTNTKTRYKCK